MAPSPHIILAGIRRVPLVHSVLRKRYARRFRSAAGAGSWHGIYPSFDAALSAVPTGAPTGYDHEAAADLYLDMLHRVQPRDYPVLYWLHRLLVDGSRVFDLGGNIGVSYRAYRTYLRQIGSIDWTVCDVPAVVEAGRERALADQLAHLHFTTDVSTASGCTVFLTSGTLQYLPTSLDLLLQTLPTLPTSVVVNMLPTMPDREVVTLQNIGLSFCPYRIMQRSALVGPLATLGYSLSDEWVNDEARDRVPYAAGLPPVTWIGQCFQRGAPTD